MIMFTVYAETRDTVTHTVAFLLNLSSFSAAFGRGCISRASLTSTPW